MFLMCNPVFRHELKSWRSFAFPISLVMSFPVPFPLGFQLRVFTGPGACCEARWDPRAAELMFPGRLGCGVRLTGKEEAG